MTNSLAALDDILKSLEESYKIKLDRMESIKCAMQVMEYDGCPHPVPQEILSPPTFQEYASGILETYDYNSASYIPPIGDRN
ncbi:MAG TPA: hypothetical protein VJB02_05045 [Coxiellaceae bacterium]|nr:hypothetical protein [Coxiellaceae bacterium]